MLHIYNGILHSHKNEDIWVSANEVDEPRAYHAEWSKSEREKQIPYFNAYIWNLERCYWWTCFGGSNADEDIKNRLVDTAGAGKERLEWTEMETYTVLC